VLHPHFLPKLHGLVERDFLDHVRSNATTIDAAHPSDKTRARTRLQHRTDPFVLVNQRQFLASEDELIAFAIHETRLSRGEILVAAAFGANALHGSDEQPAHTAVDAEESLQERAETSAHEAAFRYRHMSGNPFAFLQFELDGVPLPRVEIELFHGVCPKTCANFLAFCQHAVPDISDDVRMLGYRGTLVHRIVRGGWIQCGDVTLREEDGDTPTSRGDGKPRSLYGSTFPDESFSIAHDDVGIVSMANDGVPHTNASQFFITLAQLPSLDRKKVAFGRVVAGLATIQKIASVETVNERPLLACKIVDAGKIVD
jgi:cyclophilin family peptidyl-prolyl cis-trans isomerase